MPCVTASIKKPIHNVKEAGKSRKNRHCDPKVVTAELVSSSLEKCLVGAIHFGGERYRSATASRACAWEFFRKVSSGHLLDRKNWWSLSGSNR
jgi:hypothetical protein